MITPVPGKVREFELPGYGIDVVELAGVIKARAEDGFPIVCGDPGTSHGRALLSAFGVVIAGAVAGGPTSLRRAPATTLRGS